MIIQRRPERVVLKSTSELDTMRHTARLAAQCLEMLARAVRPGMKTLELDALHLDFARRHGATPAPPLEGFPRSVCTSVNEVVCHGIPGPRVLRAGDIVCIDVSFSIDGFFADNATTVAVGEVDARAAALMRHSLEALRRGVDAVAPGRRTGDLAHAVQSYAESHGYGVVHEFGAHGIGRRLHEPPQILHVGVPGRGVRLRPGMTFTLEPMLNVGSGEVDVLDDGWTVVSRDGSWSAQYEHTLAVTDQGVEVLTVQNEDGAWEPPGRCAPPAAPEGSTPTRGE